MFYHKVYKSKSFFHGSFWNASAEHSSSIFCHRLDMQIISDPCELTCDFSIQVEIWIALNIENMYKAFPLYASSCEFVATDSFEKFCHTLHKKMAAAFHVQAGCVLEGLTSTWMLYNILNNYFASTVHVHILCVLLTLTQICMFYHISNSSSDCLCWGNLLHPF